MVLGPKSTDLWEFLVKCHTRRRDRGTSGPPSPGQALRFCAPSPWGEPVFFWGLSDWKGPTIHQEKQGSRAGSQASSVASPGREHLQAGSGGRERGLETAVFCLLTHSETHSTDRHWWEVGCRAGGSSCLGCRDPM